MQNKYRNLTYKTITDQLNTRLKGVKDKKEDVVWILNKYQSYLPKVENAESKVPILESL